MAKTFRQLADEIKNKLIEKGLQIKRVDIDDEDLNGVIVYLSDQGASYVSGNDYATPEDEAAINANCKIVAEVIEGTDLTDIDTEVLDHTVDYLLDKEGGIGIEGVQYDGDAFMIWLKPSEEVEDEESYPYWGE